MGENMTDGEWEAEKHWLQFADFYTRPHIIHFDDCNHLEQLISDTDFDKVHDSMVEEVERRAGKVLSSWKQIIETIWVVSVQTCLTSQTLNNNFNPRNKK